MCGKERSRTLRKIFALVIIFSLLQGHLAIVCDSFNVAYAAINSSLDEIVEENYEEESDLASDISSSVETGPEFELESEIKDDSLGMEIISDDQSSDEIVENTIEEDTEDTKIENTITDENIEIEDEIEDENAEKLIGNVEILNSFRYKDGFVVKTKISSEIVNLKANVESAKVIIEKPSVKDYTLENVVVEDVKGVNEQVSFTYNTEKENIEIDVVLENAISEYKNEYVLTFVFKGIAEVSNMDINFKETLSYEIIETEEIEEAQEAEDDETIEENNSEEINVEFDKEFTVDFSQEVKLDIVAPVVNKYELNTQNSSIYKGYLYANAVSQLSYETKYTSINKVKINGLDNINYITILEKPDIIKTENGETVELDGLTSIIDTRVSKEKFDALFGENGYIEIFVKGESIGKINSETEVVDDAYVFEYETITSSVEFKFVGLNSTGEIDILNNKVIKKTSAFDRLQIMNFKNIETNINVKEVSNVGEDEIVITEANNKVEINLEETETKMDLEISSKDLSTTTVNEVSMNFILRTNEEKYELFKNPVIEVEFPNVVEKLEIKNINLLYKNGLSIENWEVVETDIGTKVARITLSGIQDEYKLDGTTEDTTVVINAAITVNRMTANGTGKLKLRYSNEVATHISYENAGKTAEEYEVNYVSRSGLLKVQKFENFNDANDVIVNYEDETVTGVIKVDETEKVAKVSMEIVNNYKTYISNVVLMGKIPFVGNKKEDINLNTTFDMSLAGPVSLNGLVAKVYYSTEENPSLDSSSWMDNVDDFSKIKTFKVVLENENMYKGEKIELSYNLNVPANVGYNAAAYNLITTYYDFNNEQIKDSSMIGIISDTKATDLDDCQTVDKESLISVGTQVTKGGVVVEEGENVNEGQILRYNVVVTNNSAEEIRNISIKGNAENANMFYWYTYQIVSSTDGKLTDTGAWKEDTTGEHLYDSAVIESLLPGQTMTFTYQVKVKHMDEINGSDVYGRIYVSADGMEEREFNTIKNHIVDADVELVLTRTGNEKLDEMRISTGEYYKLNVKVKNISDRDLENVKINLYVPGLINYDETTVYMNKYDLTTEETATGTLISINHPKLEKGAEEIFYIVTVVGNLPIETNKTSITVNSDVTVDGRTYVSNEYTRDIYQTESYITAKYYANKENGSKVNDGDIINYTLEVKNIGVVDKYILINDRLPYGLNVNKISATLSTDGSTEELTLNDRLLTKEIYVKPQETLKINIEAVVNSNDLRTEQSAITNEFVFSPDSNVDEIDEITFYINPRESIVSEAEDVVTDEPIESGVNKEEGKNNPTSNKNNNNNNNNTNKPQTNTNNTDKTNNSNSNNSSSTATKDNKYSISGKVWLDDNQDGLFEGESLLKNVKVTLYKLNGDTASITDSNKYKETVTSSDGVYTFSRLEKGKYIVVFEYDNELYGTTTYNVGGKNNSKTSKVIEKQLKLNGTNKKYAISDICEISDISIENINMGLISKNGFDMLVNTYINNIKIQTSKGTEEKEFSEEDKLVKIEIDSKQLKNAKVIVEYRVKVTNVGEVAGYINQIANYVPEGFTLVEGANKTWYLGDNNNLYNSSLNKKLINPGETVEVSLYLEKVMTTENTGVFKNITKIIDSTNEKQIKDINTNNDMSAMELIISIRTGAIGYVVMIVLILGIAVVAMLIVGKLIKGDPKKLRIIRIIITIVGIIAMVTICLMIKSNAEDIDYSGKNNLYIESFAGNKNYEGHLISTAKTLNEYYNWSWAKGQWFKLAYADGTNRVQCIHGPEISGAPNAYNAGMTSQRAMFSVTDIKNSEYSTQSYKGSASGTDAFAEGFAYLCYESENGGLDKGIFSSVLKNYKVKCQNVLKLEVTGSFNNGASETTEYKRFTEIVSKSATNATTSVAKAGDKREKIPVTSVNNMGAYGPMQVTFPTGSGTALYISTNGGSSYSKYTGNVILDNGTTTTFGDNCYNMKFYLPDSAIPSDANFDKVLIKVEGGSEVYRGRVMTFTCQGSGQNQAVLRGSKEDDVSSVTYGVEGDITVNKYISNIGSRSSYTESAKKSTPAIANTLNSVVEYTIVIENKFNKELTVEVTDTYNDVLDHGGLKYVADMNTGWTYTAPNKATQTIKIGARQTKSLKIYLQIYTTEIENEVYENEDGYLIIEKIEYTETYENKATIKAQIVAGNTITKSSSDFVKVGIEESIVNRQPELSGSLEKYISKVNSNAIHGRDDITNESKYKSPVVVEQGDSVEYTISVTNESELDIYGVEFVDTPESGLTLGNISSLSDVEIDSGDTYTTRIKATVDKSNMYLYNLENDIDVVDGYYTKVIVYTVGGEEIVHEIKNTPLPDSFIDNLNSNDKDKDYVRLKDLNIGGTVWLDNDKDGKMENETKLSDIKVSLHDVTNNTENRQTSTSSDGTYIFSGVHKGTNVKRNGEYEYYPNASKYGHYGDNVTSTHKQYYVEFEYDGVTYIPTAYSGKTNINSSDCSINSAYKTDSNATEKPSERTAFNNALETISYNKGNAKVLEFDKTGHESKLKWTDSTTMSSYSFLNGENIEKLFLRTDGETEYLEYINLGLYEREKLDLRITKDLLESNVYINEQDMKYNFAKLDTSNLYYKGGPSGTEEKYGYELYKSDYAYRSSLYYHDAVKNLKAGTELEVDLLYKVVIYNESNTTYGDTYAKINEVADFYSKQLVLDEAYMLNGSTKLPLTVENSSSYNNTSDYNHTGTYNMKHQFDSADVPQSYSTITSTNNPYNTVFIKGNDLTNKVLSSGDTVEIFIKYHLDKSAETADANDIDKWLYYGDLINVAQISAYSTYESDTSTTPKGLVDIDSNAGNVVNTGSVDSANINNPATYDDNTFRSFTVLSMKDKVREITGFVFDDTRSEKLGGDYNYFTGNGYYTDSANPNPVTGRTDTINDEAVAFFNNSSMVRYTGNDLAAAKQIVGADLSAFNIIDNMNELIQDIEADRKLSGMTVQLIEVVLDPTTNIMYEETLTDLAILTSGNVVEQTQTTGEKGHYVLSSFIPSTYVVRFKSGDAFNGDITYNSLTHNGQDYKSTTYLLNYTDDAGKTFILNSDLDRDYNAGAAGSALTAEEYNDVKYAALTEKNKSDARGNELRRLEIMSFSEVMTNEKAELLKYPTYLEHGTGKILKSATGALSEDLQKFIETTEYFADTVTVKLGIENKADTRNRIGEEVDYRDFSQIALKVENIDYGLTYRPENLVKLDKDIKSIKLTTSSSTDPLLFVEYNRNGEVVSSIGAENLQSVNNIGNVQGFRYINVDEDILQGAKLETEYYITVRNIGEVDIMDKSLNEQGGASVILNKLYTDSIATEINLPNSTKLNYTNASRLIDKVYNSASGNYKYGILVGEVYYQGVNVSSVELTDLDVVTLTVNQVLDWVDNDARIELSNNNTENKYWAAIGEKELLELGLIDDKMLYNSAGLSPEEESAGISNSRYKDELNRYYTTTDRKNLAINIDVQKNENNEIVSNPNPELIKAIYPVYAGKVNSMTAENALNATTGYIVIKTDAVLGGDNESEMMTYDNIAEIVKFTSPVGRRTNFLSTIGNIGSKSSSPKTSITDNPEPDSYMAEIIRLTPPTGASRFNLFVAGNVSVIFISITVLMLAVIVYILKYALRGKVGKSKFYK